jgi:hypothetical protein
MHEIDSPLRDERTKVSMISMAVRWITQAEPDLLMSYPSFFSDASLSRVTPIHISHGVTRPH